MGAVRIALVEMPQLSADLIRTATVTHGGFDVVAAVERAGALDEAIAPDVIFWGATDGELAHRAAPFLMSRAGAPIVGMTGGGRRASVCTATPRVEPLGRLTLRELLDLLARLGGS